MASARILHLNKNWSWKQRDHESVPSVMDEVELPEASNTNDALDGLLKTWNPAQTFPSEIHVELLKSGKIPDPYVGFGEHEVQWIGDVEWLYKCQFSFDAGSTEEHATLEFEGLDTVCDVYLNGTKILETNNQFRTYTHQFSFSNQSVLSSSNVLLLHFKSAKALAKAEEAQYGRVRAGSVNLGDPSRVYVRKAQYDWRWDWGPELMTVGPYRGITLRTYTTRIVDVHTRAIVLPSFDAGGQGHLVPSLKVDVTFEGTVVHATGLRVTLKDAKGKVIKGEELRLGLETKAAVEGNEGKPQVEVVTGAKVKEVKDTISWGQLQEYGVELWWPVGYGEQRLYVVEVELLGKDDQVLDTLSQRIGFRSVALVQEPLEEADQYGKGTTFLFEVNGIRMFIGGSNWVPADNFLTTITDERYRAWLTLLRDGNQNMVRLWGGGVYEPDVFYDICDELGILVWQDFQFACGVYPAHDTFVANVKVEAEQNVKRLRRHPSLALFCGNNEDYQQVLQWGGIGELPARKIYEQVLPAVVGALTDPVIPYHRGSPYGGKGWDTSDPTIGDVHQWNVWAGKELPYQEYYRLGGRFVSEFGMPAMPSMCTIEHWMGDASESEWYAQSKLMAQHTKAGSFERRFAIVMNENFRLTSDLETHVFYTQIMQSEAVGFAYQIWKRQWKGIGNEYARVVVWQLNDCWPVTSWAIADYFLRAKPVYYTIKRHLAPITVGIFRSVTKNRENDRPVQFYEFGAFQAQEAILEVWGTNSTLFSRRTKLELSFFDIDSPTWTRTDMYEVVLLKNQATELLTISCPGPPRTGVRHPSSSVVVSARLLDGETGEVLARHVDWPQPYRFLDFPDPGLKMEVLRNPDGKEITKISVERPVMGLFLTVAGDEAVRWSDNALNVVPGDVQTVAVSGLNGRKIKVAYLGKERASVVS